MRRRRRTGSKPAPLASLAAALGRGHQKQQEQVVTSRQVLGRAAPGEALPLPLGWSKPGRQLQLRPVLPVNGPARAGEHEQQQGSAQGVEQEQQHAAGRGAPADAQGQPAGEGEREEEEGHLHAVHDWSHGTADGRHTLKLDSMDEGITRLVCCPSLHNTGKWAGPASPGFLPAACPSPCSTAWQLALPPDKPT